MKYNHFRYLLNLVVFTTIMDGTFSLSRYFQDKEEKNLITRAIIDFGMAISLACLISCLNPKGTLGYRRVTLVPV